LERHSQDAAIKAEAEQALKALEQKDDPSEEAGMALNSARVRFE
jgi:hypothetical protein